MKFPVGFRMARGLGWIRDPKKFVNNKIYNLFSFNLLRIIKKLLK